MAGNLNKIQNSNPQKSYKNSEKYEKYPKWILSSHPHIKPNFNIISRISNIFSDFISNFFQQNCTKFELNFKEKSPKSENDIFHHPKTSKRILKIYPHFVRIKRVKKKGAGNSKLKKTETLPALGRVGQTTVNWSSALVKIGTRSHVVRVRQASSMQNSTRMVPRRFYPFFFQLPPQTPKAVRFFFFLFNSLLSSSLHNEMHSRSDGKLLGYCIWWTQLTQSFNSEFRKKWRQNLKFEKLALKFKMIKMAPKFKF